MAKRSTGKITERIVRELRKNGDTYVRLQQRQYDPEKQYMVTISSKLLGVEKKGTNKVVPTRARRKFVNKIKEEVSPLGEVKAIRKHVGMMDIINHMADASGIDVDIRSATDLPTANKILSLARYIVCSDNQSLASITEWQYNHELPYDDGISKNIYHTLFKEIGRDETLQQTFFKFRLDREDKLGVYLACDSSQISTYSKSLTDDIARFGYDENKDEMPMVKYLVLFSLSTNMPVWCTELPGNINDVVTVTHVINQLKALGIKKVTLVTDSGFFSKSNIGEMISQGYNFITLTSIKNDSMAQYYAKECHWIIQNISYACPFDLDTHGKTYSSYQEIEWTRKIGSKVKNLKAGDKDKVWGSLYYHIFFNPKRKVEQDSNVKTIVFEAVNDFNSGIKLEAMKPYVRNLVKACCDIEHDEKGNVITVKPSNYKLLDYCKYNGMFAIVTNRKLNCFECLEWYRKREHIEDFFRRAKTDADVSHPAVCDKDVLRGRMFVQFIALCLYQYVENEIKRVKETLCEDIDNNGKTKTKELKKQEKALLNILNSRSIVRILNWFDTYDSVDISVKLKAKRWSEPTVSYEKILLERLGVVAQK